MTSVSTRRITTAPGIHLTVHEAGTPGNPVVVLCHGFPETAYSWRHQMQPLVAAGFHVLAPDQRGYGTSSVPDQVELYRIDHLCADLCAVLEDVGAAEAVFVGHDWGAMVVWQMAQLHPTRTRAVVAASVPFTAWPAPPTELMAAMWGDRFFYILYFQPVGPAEAELEADVEHTLRTIAWAASGEMYRGTPAEFPPAEGTGFLDSMVAAVGPLPEGLPSWLSQDDLDVYVDAFSTSGFFGPVSWYRNLDANHALTGPIGAGAITMPSAFIGGTHDAVIAARPEYVEAMATMLPDYRGATMIQGAGHWTQQEAPEAFNDALLGILRTL
jgi:pimeloyl-ACP methyl ester carboxylesterase